jgi:hypothetical protein
MGNGKWEMEMFAESPGKWEMGNCMDLSEDWEMGNGKYQGISQVLGNGFREVDLGTLRKKSGFLGKKKFW